jgi:2-iminobutanoate/2-iminopropanoate deaminase
MKKVIHTSLAPHPIGPYSQATSFGNLIFTSGQIAIDPATGKFSPADIRSETKQVMENLKNLLAAAGTDFSKVLKTSIFLMDMGEFIAVNEVYAGYFSDQYPARETVQVAQLPAGARVEISMIATQ